MKSLAKELLRAGALPLKAGDDALHLAVAAVNAVEFLVTWNCRHLANATKQKSIEAVVRSAGYKPPIICSPEHLMGEDYDLERPDR